MWVPWKAQSDLRRQTLWASAAYVYIYGSATRRHIKNAFKAGATMQEIMEVLKLGVVQGVQACNLGVTLLAEELAREAAE